MLYETLHCLLVCSWYPVLICTFGLKTLVDFPKFLYTGENWGLNNSQRQVRATSNPQINCVHQDGVSPSSSTPDVRDRQKCLNMWDEMRDANDINQRVSLPIPKPKPQNLNICRWLLENCNSGWTLHSRIRWEERIIHSAPEGTMFMLNSSAWAVSSGIIYSPRHCNLEQWKKIWIRYNRRKFSCVRFFFFFFFFFWERAQLLLSKMCVFFFSAPSHSFHANPGLTGQMCHPSNELWKCWTDCISIYDLNAGSLPGWCNLDTTNFIIHQDQTGVNLYAHKASFGIHLLPH